MKVDSKKEKLDIQSFRAQKGLAYILHSVYILRGKNMSDNEMIKKYGKEICPNCIHYKDKNYKECSVVVTIDGQAKCVNCNCIEYCKKEVGQC